MTAAEIERVARALARHALVEGAANIAAEGKADAVALGFAIEPSVDRFWESFIPEAKAAITALRSAEGEASKHC